MLILGGDAALLFDANTINSVSYREGIIIPDKLLCNNVYQMNTELSTEPTVAELLNQLFQQRRHPSGREYTNAEVALGMRGKHDRSYVRKVRSGEIPNPGYQALLELCIFFRVPITYFFPQLDDLAVEPLPSDS